MVVSASCTQNHIWGLMSLSASRILWVVWYSFLVWVFVASFRLGVHGQSWYLEQRSLQTSILWKWTKARSLFVTWHSCSLWPRSTVLIFTVRIIRFCPTSDFFLGHFLNWTARINLFFIAPHILYYPLRYQFHPRFGWWSFQELKSRLWHGQPRPHRKGSTPFTRKRSFLDRP